MRIFKCYFCSSSVYPGHGIQLVRNDCSVLRFCRSKCNKAYKKRRQPRKTRWTKAARLASGKELTNDPCLQFEMRRDEPLTYSRQLWKDTVDAMKEVAEVKLKRNGLHIKNRLKAGKTMRKQRDLANLKKNIHLIKSPAATATKKALAEKLEQDEGVEVKPIELMEEN